MAEDPNDVLRKSGPEALRRRLDDIREHKVRQLRLAVGSDSEVAQCVARDVCASIGSMIYCDGDFYAWNRTHWSRLAVERLHAFIREYDGCEYESATGKAARYLLNKTRHNSVLHLLRLDLLKPDFFRNAPLGVSCRSGFLALAETGEVNIEPHAPEQRQRHLVDAEWAGHSAARVPSGTLLEKLFTGCFLGDSEIDEKIDFIAEMFGAAAFGLATRLSEPKAVILFGRSACNGKSQILNMMRGLLPEQAVSSVTPAEMAKEQRRVQLAGTRLNAADELGVDAIRSDTFKTMITGDRTSGKTVYQPPFEFYPEAFHVFATNALPPFADGMDRGVRRRLAILSFERTIPMNERITDLGRRIAIKETGSLLALAVSGAQRLLKQGAFSDIASGRALMNEWILMSDTVAAFFEDDAVLTLTGKREDHATSKQVYRLFSSWLKAEGIPDVHRPTHSQFTARARELGLTSLRITRIGKSGTRFNGIKLKSGGPGV